MVTIEGVIDAEDVVHTGVVDDTSCSNCGAYQQWHYCRACDAVQCSRCILHRQCTYCSSLICVGCTDVHYSTCEDRGDSDEEAKKEAEDLGRKLKKRRTSVAGVTFTSSERGSGDGVPILILPHYSISKDVMLPFLSELEKNHKLFYIDLPPISSFKGLETAGKSKIPYYPIDQLVEAFEGLREETDQEQFALLSCGMNS